MEKDHNREGPTVEKILQLFRLHSPKNTKTLLRLKKFSDLDIKKINETKNLNIKGLILDVDDCIAPNHEEILEENVKHIKKLKKQGIKIAIYSNMKANSRYDVIKDDAIILTNLPAKPDTEGFKRALKELKLKPKEVLMVGDNYITDAGSLSLGIQFVKIKPIKTVYKRLPRKIIMTVYGYLRSYYTFISKIHDLFRRN